MGCCSGDGDDNENAPRIDSDEKYYGKFIVSIKY